MIKQLILLLHLFGVFVYQLIFSGDITVTQQLPSSMESGKDVVVEIIIHKNDVTGFAKVQQVLPQGFSAEAIETKGATFSFKDNKIKFIWMALPSEEEFKISYKLKADETTSGDFTIGGKFSFISESERKNIEIPTATISVTKEIIATVEDPIEEDPILEEEPSETVNNTTEDENETEDNTEPEVETPTVIKIVSITCERNIEETSPGNYKVSIKIKKQGIEGFAKINEKIPTGFSASEIDSKGGVFSFKEQNAKILWMAIPKGDEFDISYNLISNTATNDEYLIKGSFSYLDKDVTSKYTIDGSSFTLNVPVTEPIADTETTNNNENTINRESEEPTVEDPIIEEPVTETPTQPENTITSTPNPETGITYKVQVGAGHQTVSSNYFATRFNLQDNVSTINHEGWIKYLVGSFNEYKQARDKRNKVRSNVKTAFVTAYNIGKRITVQEALMISNQKWYK
jgi:hypothetical protein